MSCGSPIADTADSVLTRKGVAAWVEAYGEAWRLQDADRICALYTEDAAYVERPYDPEGGIYRGHVGIRNYWETHVQVRERDIQFRHLEEDLILDSESRTAVVKWEAKFKVARGEGSSWKGVQFLQVAILRFAKDGRVQHFEEWWHTKSLQAAAKGLRDPRARRPRAGPKRRVPDLNGRTCTHMALSKANLGPFERETMAFLAKRRQRNTKKQMVGPLVAKSDPCEEGDPNPTSIAGQVASAPARSSEYGHQTIEQKVFGKSPVLQPSKLCDVVEWYRQAIAHSEFALESDVAGVPILRPWSAFLWAELQRWLDKELSEINVSPFRLPILAHHNSSMPSSDGNATESCNVPSLLEVRSCTEVLLYTAMSKKWVTSSRDLPVILNHWGAAVNAEAVKRPLPFLRSRELLWQEGHAAHRDATDALSFAQAVQRVYIRLCEELLAVSPRLDVSSLSEESMHDCNKQIAIQVPVLSKACVADICSAPEEGAVEIASVNLLGCDTAAAFKVEFAALDGTGKSIKKPVFQTSFSLTCRSLGACLCAHGDERGFVLPPRLAFVQVVVIPIFDTSGKGRPKAGEDSASPKAVAEHNTWCKMLAKDLQVSTGSSARSDSVQSSGASWEDLPLRVLVDGQVDGTLGKGIRKWFSQGLPLLVTVQPWTETSSEQKELRARPAVIRMVARDSLHLPESDALCLVLSDAGRVVRRELAAMHQRMLATHRSSFESQSKV